MPPATPLQGKYMHQQFWKDRRVLLTGATGLVGGWLAKELQQSGAHVIALIRDWDPQSEFIRSGDYQNASIVNGELETYRDVERAIVQHDATVVIHLAAQAIVHVAQRAPLQTFESNIRGTYNLLDACRVHASQIEAVVVASSDKAYGHSPVLPYTETMPLKGMQPYEVSKTCTDLLAQSYAVSYGLPLAIGRCGNIYGGGDLNWSRIIPDTIRSFLNNRPIQLRSDGTFIRDYIYVKDVSSAYMQMAEALANGRAAGEAFNFSPEKAVSVVDLVRAIQKTMKCEHLEPIILNTASGEIHSQYLDASKAKQMLGWTPQYSLEEGLRETIAWYKNYFDGIHANSPIAASVSIK